MIVMENTKNLINYSVYWVKIGRTTITVVLDMIFVVISHRMVTEAVRTIVKNKDKSL